MAIGEREVGRWEKKDGRRKKERWMKERRKLEEGEEGKK